MDYKETLNQNTTILTAENIKILMIYGCETWTPSQYDITKLGFMKGRHYEKYMNLHTMERMDN